MSYLFGINVYKFEIKHQNKKKDFFTYCDKNAFNNINNEREIIKTAIFNSGVYLQNGDVITYKSFLYKVKLEKDEKLTQKELDNLIAKKTDCNSYIQGKILFVNNDLINWSEQRIFEKEDTKESFGQRLKRMRKISGLKQKDVANQLGLSKTSYLYYEHNKTEPSLKTLSLIKDIYNIDFNTLLSNISFGK